MISLAAKKQIAELKAEFDQLKHGKDNLLKLIDESEIPESVYNSNAIENSTLSLQETEKILLEMEVSRKVSLREVFEAKNLARVMDYLREKKAQVHLSLDFILFLHHMLISGISDEIAGRFRQENEYVKVGSHIAPPPEHVDQLLEQNIGDYQNDLSGYFLEKIARFHLQFEHIHPFNDGNGRIGRLLTNLQLMELGLPPVIFRDKEKKLYYQALKEYDQSRKTKRLEENLWVALMESLHKRLAYLKGYNIIPLTKLAETTGKSTQTLLNAAKRQTIPAFREKGTWRIGIALKLKKA
ncbi:Fic family protein [Candidatus Peregrinibacteria bacterium]|nr:Fic family protein [Candidatus Peregrinibacteria bacterium]